MRVEGVVFVDDPSYLGGGVSCQWWSGRAEVLVVRRARKVRKIGNEGTWCSWLSRSLSISLENLREGSGSIPDVSIFIFI